MKQSAARIRVAFALCVFAVLVICLWVVRKQAERIRGETTASSRHGLGLEHPESQDGRPVLPMKTKSAVRENDAAFGTHRPAQLRDFYLRPLEFDGIPLSRCLELLRAAYQDACGVAGEVALPLEFIQPVGVNPVVRGQIRNSSVEGAVQFLAGASGLRVRRHGVEFRFELPSSVDPERAVVKQFDLPVDKNLTEILAQANWRLAEDTTIIPGASGFTVESRSARDLAAIESLLEYTVMNPPIQQKIAVRIVRLPPGSAWNYGNQVVIREAEYADVIRRLQETEGVEMDSYPSVTTRPGELAKVETIREVIIPGDLEMKEFEKHSVGMSLDVTPGLLAFGNDVKSSLALSSVVDEPSGMASIYREPEMVGNGYVTDRSVMVESRTGEDGSTTVLLMEPSRLDATGRSLDAGQGAR